MADQKREHALLSASGAERWLHCTPSARLEDTFPDVSGPYAEEGSLAHTMAELKVRKKFIEPMGPKKYHTRLNKLKRDPLYQSEMGTCTDDYLDYISGVALKYESEPYVTAEVKLDYGDYAPEGFGTADCIIIGDNTLHVIDFKYGKGTPVTVEHNPQLMLYGLGALNKYQLLYNIGTVALTIFQPRAQGETVKEWSVSTEKLLAWGDDIKPTARIAFDGKGEFVPGDWCRFCRARGTCRSHANQYTALEDFGDLSETKTGSFPVPPLLSDTEVGEVLKRAIDIEKWISELKEYALNAVLSGKTIPGWKAVEGRSRRVWDNMDKAFNDIKAAGVDEELMYERKPLTLAALEKVIGKKKFMEIAGNHIVKEPGKPTLAVESDKREAVTAITSAEEDFKNLN